MALSVGCNGLAGSIDSTSASAYCGGGATGAGFVWSHVSSSPTIGSNQGARACSISGGIFSMSSVDMRLCGTSHCYIRAYATNGASYVYSSCGDQGASSPCLVVPTVTTTAITSITFSGATGGGNVTSAGYPASVTARGVCWNTSANPTIANNHTSNGTGTGSFSSAITGLLDNTTYHVRAYATNNTGTAYGADIPFITLSRPLLTTKAISGITETTANSGGNVSFSGSSAITARGICWATTTLPTIAGHHLGTTGTTGNYYLTLTGLNQNNTYYVRAYATNTQGTNYGNEQTFSIAITAPRLTGGTDVHLFPLIGWSGKTQVTTWTGATNQRWYNKISTDANYTLIATLGKTTGNTYNKLDLKPNINYSFYATFYSILGETSPSNVITINNSVATPVATYSSILII
jgi:hypothetical protein